LKRRAYHSTEGMHLGTKKNEREEKSGKTRGRKNEGEKTGGGKPGFGFSVSIQCG
jgi:hypothetical protein